MTKEYETPLAVMEKDAKEHDTAYWKSRALQAEQVAKVLMTEHAPEPKVVAELIAHHVSDNLVLCTNTYKQAVEHTLMILGQMAIQNKLEINVVNMVVKNLTITHRRFTHEQA